MFRIALYQKNISRFHGVGYAVDAMFPAAGSDNDQFWKIMRMPDIGQVSFVMDLKFCCCWILT